MKQPKRPTREQKELMQKNGYDWRKYNVVEQTPMHLIIQSKETGAVKQIVLWEQYMNAWANGKYGGK